MANASNGDSYTSEFLSYFTIQLTQPTLSEIAEDMCIQRLLFNSPNTSFDALCDTSFTKWNATLVPWRKSRHSPYLTTAPYRYNLAGVGKKLQGIQFFFYWNISKKWIIHTGLGGNTSVVEFVHDGIPWNYKTRNIQDVLTTSCRNSFIIGSTYATKPHMPYYGHVRIINIFTFSYPCR